jgi:antitoxin MazE
MRVHAKIQKWGNGLALRVSGVMRDIPHFQEGTEVDIDVNENGFLVIKSMPKTKCLFPFSESELLQGLKDGQTHADLLANPLKSELP